MHEAKTQFSALVRAVEAGEEVVVRRGDKPVAKIVAYVEAPTQRVLGDLEGQGFWIADDFDDFIPPEFEEYLA